MKKDREVNRGLDIEKTQEIRAFNDSPALSFIHKKAERISCAIHLVTNHLHNQEPLKWVCRNSSLDLIKDIFSLRINFSDNSSIFENLNYKTVELLSFLDLLATTGSISQMNCTILRGEIIDLSKFIGSKGNITNSPKSDFDENFFKVPEYIHDDENISQYTFEREKSLKDYYKGHGQGHTSKGHISFGNMSLKTLPNTQTSDTKNPGSKRKQDIIKFIKDKKEVNIKDITSFIKNYSEKTLQRDLVSLVKAGIIKREGERRWSKYLLA